MSISRVLPSELSDRLLVTGDRDWFDLDAVEAVLDRLHPAVLIHGGARGADRMADHIAHRLGLEVEEYLAQWEKFGRAAGPLRNLQMLTEGKPTGCVWFHRDLASSKGTKDMVARARKSGVVTWSWEEVLGLDVPPPESYVA